MSHPLQRGNLARKNGCGEGGYDTVSYPPAKRQSGKEKRMWGRGYDTVSYPLSLHSACLLYTSTVPSLMYCRFYFLISFPVRHNLLWLALYESHINIRRRFCALYPQNEDRQDRCV